MKQSLTHNEPEIVAMLQAGLTPESIAEEMDIGLEVVHKIKKRNKVGAEPRTVRQRLGPEEVQEVCSEYTTGASVFDIALKHKLNYNALYGILKAAGVELRRNAQALGMPLRVQKVVQMYESGEKLWRISGETGFAQPQIHEIIRDAGLETRREKRRREQQEEDAIAEELERSGEETPEGSLSSKRKWPYNTRLED